MRALTNESNYGSTPGPPDLHTEQILFRFTIKILPYFTKKMIFDRFFGKGCWTHYLNVLVSPQHNSVYVIIIAHSKLLFTLVLTPKKIYVSKCALFYVERYCKTFLIFLYTTFSMFTSIFAKLSS